MHLSTDVMRHQTHDFVPGVRRGLDNLVGLNADAGSEQRMLLRELPQLTRRLVEIRAPTTVVCGSADRVVPMQAARALAAQIPDAELVVLEGAGHLIHQGQAGELASVILKASGAQIDDSDPVFGG